MRGSLLAICLTLIATTVSATDAPPLPPMTLAEAAAVRAAETEAMRMYLIDRAAWIATDAITSHRKVDLAKMNGWVTEPIDQDRYRVTFVSGSGDAAMAYIRVETRKNVKGIRSVKVLNPLEPLSRYEQQANAARELAMQQNFMVCTPTMNTVLYPKDATLEQWVVYLLSSTTEAHKLPVGGSYRFDIDLRSREVKRRDYTRSCLTLEGDDRDAIAFITHLLDPLPTELHAFLSLSRGAKLGVGITENQDFWYIKNGKFTLIRRGGAPDPEPSTPNGVAAESNVPAQPMPAEGPAGHASTGSADAVEAATKTETEDY